MRAQNYPEALQSLRTQYDGCVYNVRSPLVKDKEEGRRQINLEYEIERLAAYYMGWLQYVAEGSPKVRVSHY